MEKYNPWQVSGDREADTRSYSPWQAFYLSFYSMDFYAELYRKGRGIMALYLLVLVLLLWLPSFLSVRSALNTLTSDGAGIFYDQIPEITIRDGEASINAPQPYIITEPENGGEIIILDTTGEVTSLEEREAKVL